MNNVSTVQVMECDIDDIESRFDDLYEAQRLVSEHKLKEGVLDSEMKKFNSVVTKTLRTFRSAISSLDKEKVAECLEAYEQALDGEEYDEKFATYWREMIAKKVSHKLSLNQKDLLFRCWQNLFSLRLIKSTYKRNGCLNKESVGSVRAISEHLACYLMICEESS